MFPHSWRNPLNNRYINKAGFNSFCVRSRKSDSVPVSFNLALSALTILLITRQNVMDNSTKYNLFHWN